MAAAAPSHRIHTIHGAFGAPSRYGHSSSLMNPAQASWNRIPNVCAPRRPYEMVPAPVARTTPASGSGAGSTSSGTGLATGLGLRSASTSRPRRTTMSAGSWGPSPAPSRRAPPPPPPAPAERTAPVCIPRTPHLPQVIPIPEVDDPFADAEPQHQDDLSPFPPARTRTRVSVPSYTMSLCVPPGLGASVPCAKDVRGRLVATTLLNRGSGRPLGVYLRRRLSGEGTTYVKSGLSQLVAAAA
ncbi:hypothetical protein OH76DRAFT_1354337 [Lentinus brumalis]|uniref:Uncharacterized protein n=1 Tax=Lentinus brumalis TaxID=2498619 RepID=A0A371D4A3_9APHY|nr:hypothetical protein OH76DRAFT_1354337 [Polyporus brumalis]